jgi:hypothetical protein
MYKVHNKFANCPKNTLTGDFPASQGDCSDRVYSDLMILETAKREAGPYEKQPKV